MDVATQYISLERDYSAGAFEHPQENALRLVCSVDAGENLTGALTLLAEIHASQRLEDITPLATVELAMSDADGPWNLDFTAAKMALDVPDGLTHRNYWLVISATYADEDRPADTLATRTIRIIRTNASLNASIPPSPLLDYYTAAQITALLTPLWGILVTDQATFAAAAAGGARRITYNADIEITSLLTILRGTELNPCNGAHIVQGGGGSVLFNGEFPLRQQLFSGFAAGEVKGNPNGGKVFPEYFLMVADHHETAINAAIQMYLPGVCGNVISAGPSYRTSASIDLTDSLSILIAAGDGRCDITSTLDWSGTWETTALYGTLNHSAMIWIGGASAGIQTYRTGVIGVNLNGLHACEANYTKRISLISAKAAGGVEENTCLFNIGGEYFTGVGVGFLGTSANFTVNGLEARGLWLRSGLRRDNCFGLYFGFGTVRATVSDYTVDCTIGRELTSAAITPPPYVWDWPNTGVYAGGQTLLQKGHVEGVQKGVLIEQAAAPNNVIIDGLNVNHLMRGDMAYFDEPVTGYTTSALPPPSLADQLTLYPGHTPRYLPFLDQYSTAVMICHTSTDATDGCNRFDSAIIRMVKATGQCDYLLRDPIYKHVLAWNQGQFQLSAANGCLKEYIRNNSYRPLAIPEWRHVTISVGSPGVITCAAHGLVAGDSVRFTATGWMPDEIEAGTIHFVTATGLTADAFTVALTSGGSPINTTGTGTGTINVMGGTVGAVYSGLPVGAPSPVPTDKVYFRVVE